MDPISPTPPQSRPDMDIAADSRHAINQIDTANSTRLDKESSMTEISELVRVFSRYLVAQAELARCRATASGNVDYYSFGYAADMHQAEQLLAQALDDYIGHRVAVELKQLRVPAAQPLPVA